MIHYGLINKNVILLKKTLHRKYPRRHYITERSNESCQIDLAYVKLPNMEKQGFILMIGTIQILRNHYNDFFKKIRVVTYFPKQR